MEKILEQIQNARQELINSYFELEKEHDSTAKLCDEYMSNMKSTNFDDAKVKEAFITVEREGTKLREIRVAINELGNALGHLGIETETFWGK